MRTAILALVCSVATAQELVPVAQIPTTQTQCGPQGCCPGGQCYPPQVYQPPQQRPPQQPPRYEPRPPQTSPQPLPGKACDCAEKWEKIDKWAEQKVNVQLALIAKLEARIADLESRPGGPSQQDIALIVNQCVQQYFKEHPQPLPPNINDIADTVIGKLPPIHIRVQDPRGAGYSTEYQSARLGQYVTLPFGPHTQ